MTEAIVKGLRKGIRVTCLLVAAALIVTISHVNMAVAGIGGISGKTKMIEESDDGLAEAQRQAAVSITQLQAAIQRGVPDAELRDMARGAGYIVVIG